METKIGAFFGWARGLLARSDLGRRGEDVAVRELKRLGYEILERRWRTRIGEIDVVAREGDTVVVVEVKARTRSDYGSPGLAVDGAKRRKLLKLARAYLGKARNPDVSVRFDVVEVTFPPGKAPRVDVHRSAFEER